MAFYAFYICCLTVYMFRSRVRAIKAQEMPMNFFKVYKGDATDRVIVIGRHYDNQFQVPMLFFMTCLAHMAVNVVNTTTLALAWGFVVSRLIHSYVHLGGNKIRKRVIAFAVGWVLILLMWIQLIYFLGAVPVI